MIKKIIIFCLVVQTAFSQKLDLRLLTKFGMDQNRDLALALKRIDLQKSLVNTAFEMPKTKVDLQVGNIQTPFVTDYTLGIVQNTELPRVYKIRKAFNESLVKIGESEYQVLKYEYRFNVANLYYELFYLQQVTDLLQTENLKLAEIEKVYKRRQELGETDGTDAAGMHLRILENEMKINQISNKINETEGNLKLILNAEILPDLSFNHAQLDAKANISQNARLEMQQNMIQNSEILTKNEMDKLLPSINLGVMNQSMLGSWRQFIGVAGVEIPIFSKAQKARVEASKISTKIQESELEKLKFQLMNEVQFLQKNLLSTESSLSLIKNNLLIESDRLMQTTMKKYLAGQIEYFDWYLVYNQNLNYKMELLNLEKSKNFTITNIKYLIGNE
ncbi:TolC family protein [Lacihabitans soyangensis]|uniref:TolC family protein n=1 Tax=Lacihabitans soyangensis TaxID=869394 RepID=A0AAE3H293_9BACT|nr:TolC family protein [Lacihabitans soyangensis]MCP9761520.1 TolC family protein [Lacihabitans soyangensis]